MAYKLSLMRSGPIKWVCTSCVRRTKRTKHGTCQLALGGELDGGGGDDGCNGGGDDGVGRADAEGVAGSGTVGVDDRGVVLLDDGEDTLGLFTLLRATTFFFQQKIN